MGTAEFNAGGNPAMGEVEIHPSCFMLQKPEMSAGLMGHLARMQAFKTGQYYYRKLW